jgi:OmpR-family two-component system manganese-sensing sensor histidine kinase
VIQTNVQAALVEPDLDQTQQQQLQVVERLTRRLGRLVDDLLFLARQDSGIVQPQWTTVDLDEVLLEVTEEQSRNAMEQGVNLHLSFDDADEGDRFPFRLRGDREQLARLFTNLISNGIQYTPAEGKVQISLQYGEGGKAKGKSGNKILVQVQDTGSGIAPEAMGHVFDRFYRADPARSRQTTTGSGLGLAIAQAIVQNHHGQIRVASSAQQGTTFSVILPIEEEF